MLLGHITNEEKLAIANAQLQLVDAFRCNGEFDVIGRKWGHGFNLA